jgi:hypothetical protein
LRLCVRSILVFVTFFVSILCANTAALHMGKFG